MKLTYRGISYEYDHPTIEVIETEIEGKYRGAEGQLVTVTKTPIVQRKYALKYRGVGYGIVQVTPSSEVMGAEPALS